MWIKQGANRKLIGKRFEDAWNKYASFAALAQENYRPNNLLFFPLLEEEMLFQMVYRFGQNRR